jgi:hypothetical protein
VIGEDAAGGELLDLILMMTCPSHGSGGNSAMLVSAGMLEFTEFPYLMISA